jgi:hypothetical protein
MKFVTLVVLLGVSLVNFAQSTPAVVLAAFEAQYPTALDISWTFEDDNEWEATFTYGENTFHADYTVDGAWMETEMEMEVAELDTEVATAIKKQFTGFEIIEVEWVENPLNKGYIVEIQQGAMRLEVTTDENGKASSKKMAE